MPYSMRKLIVVFVLTIIIVLSSFGYWQYGNQAVNPQDKTNKIFVIEKGASIREIGNKLRKEGLLRDPVVFFLYIKLYGQDRKIQAGDYRLSPSMSLKEIVDALNHGTLDRWVTFPEGIRAHEIADLLKENIPSYRESWRERLNENEGYLFPDTYLVPKDADVEMVIAMMKNNFFKKINMVGSELNDPQLQKRVLIIASLIEREAITDEEKPIISGIIDKRLKMGMALQVDATTHILIPVFLPGQSPTRVLKQSEQRSTLPAHLIYIIFMILPARFILQRQWKNTMQTSRNTSNKRKVLGVDK